MQKFALICQPKLYSLLFICTSIIIIIIMVIFSANKKAHKVIKLNYFIVSVIVKNEFIWEKKILDKNEDYAVCDFLSINGHSRRHILADDDNDADDAGE